MILNDELKERLARSEPEAYELFAALIVQEALKMLPAAVRNLSTEAFLAQKSVRDFYEQNPELSDKRQLVQQLIENEERRNPGLPLDAILKRVGPKAKQQAKIQQRVVLTPVGKPDVHRIDKVINARSKLDI